MREAYKNIFKKIFTKNLIQKRDCLGITQETTADLLHMTHRAYSKLEHEEGSCSGLTLALYLIYVDPDPLNFLQELKDALEQDYKEEQKAV